MDVDASPSKGGAPQRQTKTRKGQARAKAMVKERARGKQHKEKVSEMRISILQTPQRQRVYATCRSKWNMFQL
jgi:hypothetical protein